MKPQAVRRSDRFLRVRALWRRIEPTPYFAVALCSLALFAAVYTLAFTFLAAAP